MNEHQLTRRTLIGTTGATTLLGSSRARAAPPIRIGVLSDMSGPYADSAGPGAVAAVHMAVKELGGIVLGSPVEVLQADTLNKPDVASTIAKSWYDRDGVDVIVDLPVTSVAAGVQTIAREKARSVMITAAASADLTAKSCSAFSTHWADDTNSLCAGNAVGITRGGDKSWYFITVDYAFGTVLQNRATELITANGGTVVGSTRFPLGNTEFSSMIVSAQASGAKVIGLAAVGNDLVNLVKQCSEFGVATTGKQRLAGFVILLTDIHALGLPVAQHLTYPTQFYWDDSDQTRAFSRAFFAERQAMPTSVQACDYIATRHFLTCMQAAGTRDAATVNRAMRSTKVDFFGQPATLRDDGRFMPVVGLYEVKTPAESKGNWDYCRRIGSVSGADAYPPSTCNV